MFKTVKRMPQTVTFGGTKYGPSETPIQVPADLALALGLEVIEDQAAATPQSSLEEDLRAAQTLTQQMQRNLSLLVDQLAPHAQEGEMPDQVLSRLLSGQGEIQRLKSVEAERDSLKTQLERLRQENENNVRSMNSVGQQLTGLTAEHEETQQQLAALTTERDALKKQLADAKPIPEDALARLEGVKGIGKDLAQKGLDALTAPAKDGK